MLIRGAESGEDLLGDFCDGAGAVDFGEGDVVLSEGAEEDGHAGFVHFELALPVGGLVVGAATGGEALEEDFVGNGEDEEFFYSGEDADFLEDGGAFGGPGLAVEDYCATGALDFFYFGEDGLGEVGFGDHLGGMGVLDEVFARDLSGGNPGAT